MNRETKTVTEQSQELRNPESPLPRRQRSGVWRRRFTGLLVLAALAFLGLGLAKMTRLGTDRDLTSIHCYAKNDRSRSIHIDFESLDGSPSIVSALVFARVPVEIDFSKSLIQFEEGRVVTLPDTDHAILINTQGRASEQPFRNRFQLLSTVGSLENMSFLKLRDELDSLDPVLAKFWQ